MESVIRMLLDAMALDMLEGETNELFPRHVMSFHMQLFEELCTGTVERELCSKCDCWHPLL